MGINDFGLVPSDIYIYKIFSSMFLHGSWMHLIGNMAYLWIFGNNIEDYLGHVSFLIFYLFCGICATTIHIISDFDSVIPVVGASGAISGILGAYLILYPKAKVKLLVWFGIVTILRVKASIVLIFWFIYQFISVFKSSGEGGGVAWWAHIGGFIAGLFVIFLLGKKKLVEKEKSPWE
ncbi:MAG: rhomboid family intramembrane serine protease [Pelagibacteraceae bacterium]|nr:rhomboid family intramembrane serine protease [Pelagibacteraceae bacterium]|tara:strand:+ start:12981 stop:13514 length:534 start_codon:yes stop_codon:yes gene_type:complete